MSCSSSNIVGQQQETNQNLNRFCYHHQDNYTRSSNERQDADQYNYNHNPSLSPIPSSSLSSSPEQQKQDDKTPRRKGSVLSLVHIIDEEPNFKSYNKNNNDLQRSENQLVHRRTKHICSSTTSHSTTKTITKQQQQRLDGPNVIKMNVAHSSNRVEGNNSSSCGYGASASGSGGGSNVALISPTQSATKKLTKNNVYNNGYGGSRHHDAEDDASYYNNGYDEDDGSLSSSSARYKGHPRPASSSSRTSGTPYIQSNNHNNLSNSPWSALKGLVGHLTKHSNAAVELSPAVATSTSFASSQQQTSPSSTSPYDDSSSSSPNSSPNKGVGGGTSTHPGAPTFTSPISPRTYYRMRQRQKARQRQEQKERQMKEHGNATSNGVVGGVGHPQQQRRRVLIHHGHGTTYHDGISSSISRFTVLGNNKSKKQGNKHNNEHHPPSLIYSIVTVQLVLLLIICLGTLPYMLTLVHFSQNLVQDQHQHYPTNSNTNNILPSSSELNLSGSALSNNYDFSSPLLSLDEIEALPSLSKKEEQDNTPKHVSSTPLSLDEIEALTSLSTNKKDELVKAPTIETQHSSNAKTHKQHVTSSATKKQENAVQTTTSATSNLRGNSNSLVSDPAKGTSHTTADNDPLTTIDGIWSKPGSSVTPKANEGDAATSAVVVPSSGTDGVAADIAQVTTTGNTNNGLIDDPNIAPDVPLVDLDLPLLHVVNSRFMQDQAELLHLAKARLDLFETFCFPGLAGQTIQPPPLHRRRQQRQKVGEEEVRQDDDDEESRSDDMLSDGDNLPLEPPTVDELKQYRFLWLLKVDPELDEESLKRLIELMEPHPNFFVLGSNVNYGIGVRPGSWRGGEAGAGLFDASETTIYTGSIPLLKYAHAARESKIVVETRLDADDGLPFHFLEAMGNTALQKLSPPGTQIDLGEDALITSSLNHHDSPEEAFEKATWLYWCAHESINWYPTAMYKGLKEADVDVVRRERDPGRYTIDARGHDGHAICLTPGLSSGLAVGVTYDEMPHIGHFTLMHDLPMLQDTKSCGLSNIRYCLHVVDMRPIRSRTPTSAGMKNLQIEGKGVSEDLIEKQWNYVKEVFGITKDSVFHTNLAMQEELLKILIDNYQGQCTVGHSCKKDTKNTLLEMIRTVGGQEAIDNLPSKLLVYQKKALKLKNGEKTDVVDKATKEYKKKLDQEIRQGIRARMKEYAEQEMKRQQQEQNKSHGN